MSEETRDQIGEALAAIQKRTDEREEQAAWDRFAAAAIREIGDQYRANDEEQLYDAEHAELAADLADAMMLERAKRIAARSGK